MAVPLRNTESETVTSPKITPEIFNTAVSELAESGEKVTSIVQLSPGNKVTLEQLLVCVNILLLGSETVIDDTSGSSAPAVLVTITLDVPLAFIATPKNSRLVGSTDNAACAALGISTKREIIRDTKNKVFL